MKHASKAGLSKLAPLLARLRRIDGLTERKLGVFYLRSSAFLHFHEDPQGLFADVKLNGRDFTRLPVNGRAEQDAMMSRVADVLVRATSQRRGRTSRAPRSFGPR